MVKILVCFNLYSYIFIYKTPEAKLENTNLMRGETWVISVPRSTSKYPKVPQSTQKTKLENTNLMRRETLVISGHEQSACWRGPAPQKTPRWQIWLRHNFLADSSFWTPWFSLDWFIFVRLEIRITLSR